jgi:uncharacterized protein
VKSNHTPWNPERLDVIAFAQEGAVMKGHWAVSGFERLMSACATAAAISQENGALVEWQITGEHKLVLGADPQIWLHLKADAEVNLTCQRCLDHVFCPLQIDRHFLFVKDETAALEWDEAIEEEVLEMTSSLDVRALVEDELLLALPLVPRHEMCSHQSSTAAWLDAQQQEESSTANPFAVLAKLKKGS